MARKTEKHKYEDQIDKLREKYEAELSRLRDKNEEAQARIHEMMAAKIG